MTLETFTTSDLHFNWNITPSFTINYLMPFNSLNTKLVDQLCCIYLGAAGCSIRKGTFLSLNFIWFLGRGYLCLKITKYKIKCSLYCHWSLASIFKYLVLFKVNISSYINMCLCFCKRCVCVCVCVFGGGAGDKRLKEKGIIVQGRTLYAIFWIKGTTTWYKDNSFILFFRNDHNEGLNE